MRYLCYTIGPNLGPCVFVVVIFLTVLGLFQTPNQLSLYSHNQRINTVYMVPLFYGCNPLLPIPCIPSRDIMEVSKRGLTFNKFLKFFKSHTHISPHHHPSYYWEVSTDVRKGSVTSSGEGDVYPRFYRWKSRSLGHLYNPMYLSPLIQRLP